jgi:hypothetical protein
VFVKRVETVDAARFRETSAEARQTTERYRDDRTQMRQAACMMAIPNKIR